MYEYERMNEMNEANTYLPVSTIFIYVLTIFSCMCSCPYTCLDEILFVHSFVSSFIIVLGCFNISFPEVMYV